MGQHVLSQTVRSSGLFCSLFDPQEAHLGAKVESISNMRKEVVWITGGTGRHRGPVLHHVVMDVLWKDATLLQENPVGESDVHMWLG